MAVETPETPSKTSLWNLPNQLTMSRLLLGAVLFVFIEWRLWIACIVVFALAVITDWLDGYYARKLNLVSALGRMLDPLVDKIVVCGAFILLLTIDPGDYQFRAAIAGLSGWMVVVIVGREFLVTGVRSFMEQEGIPFGADRWGKLKMVLQCAVLLANFLFLALENYCFELREVESELLPASGLRVQIPFWPSYAIHTMRDLLVWGMLVVTVGSGLNYCWKAAQGLARKTAPTDNERDPPGKPGAG